MGFKPFTITRSWLVKFPADKIKDYWMLIKPLQTGLLLATGLAGFMTARCPVIHLYMFLILAASLFLAISGSTVINMWYDNDIDTVMYRTRLRPMVSGRVSKKEVLCLGLGLTIAGVGLAVILAPLYGLMVFIGWFFDVAVYTLWLKRRNAWSIIFGGIAGGMPILAGRFLGMGSVDVVGIILALAILFWIPTHILTFAIRYDADYQSAHIPTFASVYGYSFTRKVIALSSVFAALAIAAAGIMIGVQWGFVRVLAVMSIGLLLLAFASVFRPTERINFGLFKYASLYMLSAMLLLSL